MRMHCAPEIAPRISVVVPTYRRPELLQRCLAALLRQNFARRDYEIVVVDDARSEYTRRQVEAIARVSPGMPRLRYVRAEAGRGPAVARNCGWRAARAPLVA